MGEPLAGNHQEGGAQKREEKVTHNLVSDQRERREKAGRQV